MVSHKERFKAPEYKRSVQLNFKEGALALPIQLCWEMKNESTQTIEIRGLIKACEVFDSKKGFIITYDTEDSFEEKGIHISVIPAWKWCAKEMDLLGFA